MKTTAVIHAAALALVANDADAFFMPAGVIAGGAFSTALLSSSTSSMGRQPSLSTAASHGAGCSCSLCSPRGAHGRSCTCPSCTSSAAVSGLSHGAGCRCGACSVRMQAHPDGCGCGDCSSTLGSNGAFHGASCKCPTCVGTSAHSVSCTCSACMVSGRGQRAASKLTVMGMGGGQSEQLGEAATAFRQRLVDEPQSVVFEDTMAAVEEGFDYSPKRFVNGVTSSDAGANEGSCKVFSFGKIAELSASETLACFGEHYRSVVDDPSGDSHGNIRAFMDSGLEGISFPDGLSLSVKKD